MPKMYTNDSRKPVQPREPSLERVCISSYEEYNMQRVEVSDMTEENVNLLTGAYKKRICDPLTLLNGNLEMGEYFVIPIAELREMIDASDKIEYVHICCALRDTINSQGQTKTFPVTILVPVERSNADADKENFKVYAGANSTFIEAYPCPPDPRCPKNELVGPVLDINLKLNTFNSLF